MNKRYSYIPIIIIAVIFYYHILKDIIYLLRIAQ